MPDYNFDAANGNVCNDEMSGVAIDTHGNVSKKANIILTVTYPAIHNTTSEFMPEKITLPADNALQQTLTLQVKDIHGNPVKSGENKIMITTQNE